jgi:hypothetical protein
VSPIISGGGGSGGSKPAIGCSYALDGSVVVANDYIPWNLRVYDTDGFIAEAADEFHVLAAPVQMMTIPAGKGGLYLLAAVVYTDNQPAGGRVDPLPGAGAIAAILEEPSLSCDFQFVCVDPIYDPAVSTYFRAVGAFVRPLQDGDTVALFISNEALRIAQGTSQTTVTLTRLSDLPDGWDGYTF